MLKPTNAAGLGTGGLTMSGGTLDLDSLPSLTITLHGLTAGVITKSGTGTTALTVFTPDETYLSSINNGSGVVGLIVGGTATQTDYSSFAVTCYDPGVSDLGLEVNDVPPVLQLSGDQVATAGQDLDLSPIGRFTHAPVTSGDFTYEIDWNDGSTPDTGTATIIDPGSDTSPLVGTISDDHTYATAGIYYVTVTVTDPNGGSDTQSLQVTVNADPPTPSDPGLLAAARQALGLPANASVSAAQWASITSLTADSNAVLSLAGLENAVNLQSLTLVPSSFADPGHLTDLSPLIR
jgi:PKD repeat protein